MNESKGENKPLVPARNNGMISRWQKGESGNPAGMKPGTKQFKTIMRLALEQKVFVDVDGEMMHITRAEALVFELMKLATESPNEYVKLAAIKEIFDRTDGKAIPQEPDNQGDEEKETVVWYIPQTNLRIK